MSVSDEISRLSKAKTNLASAIIAKGVNVPSDASISNYHTLVLSISNDGGNADTVDGLHFKVSSVVPTVDDTSIITFVV